MAKTFCLSPANIHYGSGEITPINGEKRQDNHRELHKVTIALVSLWILAEIAHALAYTTAQQAQHMPTRPMGCRPWEQLINHRNWQLILRYYCNDYAANDHPP